MKRMSKEKIMELASLNNGIITSAMIDAEGLSRGSLRYLTEQGLLEKVDRGVYTLPEVWEDEFVSLQSRFKKGIFSGETVLFLCDLTDRTPSCYHMTFPDTYNLTNVKKENVRCFQAKEPYYSMGIVELTTPSGNKVRAYNIERTLCDILRTRRHTDIQIVVEAFQRYTQGNEKNIPLLAEYASNFHVEKRLSAYLEVLL